MTLAISPLRRHILLRLVGVAGALSLILLAAFLFVYRGQLVGERLRVSLGVNLLLQAALENAMLKRDVPGLADIVSRMGKQPGIRNVMILDPAGEVRFSASPAKLGARYPQLVPARGATPSAEFVQLDGDEEVLRSVNPVINQAQCGACHGAVAGHPLNGVLVVDYVADEIRSHAWKSGLIFATGGVLALALIMTILWRSLSLRVLAPVAALGRAAEALEQGRLGERVGLDSRDELGELGARFDRMAQTIEGQMSQLRMHEAYLQEVLDALPDGIRVICVDDKRTTLVNGAFCRQIGRDAAALLDRPCHLGSHASETACVPTLVVCPLSELRDVGQTIKCTHRHIRADGSAFPAEIHATLVELGGSNGRMRYIVESCRDLGQTVNISQEQRLAEMGLLAAGVAHEIHNPLASVRLGVQGLAREARAHHVSPQQVVDYMSLVDQEIDKCIAVTRRLLLLAPPPSSEMLLVDLNSALADTMGLLSFDAQTRGVEQRLVLPAESLRLLADEAEVRMILLNLVQNAHHAMPAGGCVELRLRRAAGEAVIEVADSGIGIKPEFIERIFDPFFSRRADGVTGTGLGLTIVKSIVDRLQGTISVESEPDRGTTFRIRLPLAESSIEQIR